MLNFGGASQHEGKTAGAQLLIGFSSRAVGPFRTALTMSADSTGRNQQIVIPYDTPVSLVLGGSFFQLADSAGVPFSISGAAIPLIVPTGNQPATVKLAVTGGGH